MSIEIHLASLILNFCVCPSLLLKLRYGLLKKTKDGKSSSHVELTTCKSPRWSRIIVWCADHSSSCCNPLSSTPTGAPYELPGASPPGPFEAIVLMIQPSQILLHVEKRSISSDPTSRDFNSSLIPYAFQSKRNLGIRETDNVGRVETTHIRIQAIGETNDTLDRTWWIDF